MSSAELNENSALGFHMSFVKFHFSGNLIFWTGKKQGHAVLAGRLRSPGHWSVEGGVGSGTVSGFRPEHVCGAGERWGGACRGRNLRALWWTRQGGMVREEA